MKKAMIENQKMGNVGLNEVNVKPEPEHYEIMVLNCLELAIEKLDFLSNIPTLCHGFANRDKGVDSHNESTLLDAVYDLFLCQLAWIESKEKQIQISVDGEEDDEDDYVNHITAVVVPSAHVNNGSTRSVIPVVSKELKHEEKAISGASTTDFDDDETKTSLFWNLEKKYSRKPTLASTSLRKTDCKLTSSLLNDTTSSQALHPTMFFEGKCYLGQTSTSSDFIRRVFQTSSENAEESLEHDLSSISAEKHDFEDDVTTLLNDGGDRLRTKCNKLSSSQSQSSENACSHQLGFVPPCPAKSNLQTISEHLEDTHQVSNDDEAKDTSKHASQETLGMNSSITDIIALDAHSNLNFCNNRQCCQSMTEGNNSKTQIPRQMLFEALPLPTPCVHEYFRARIKSLYGHIFQLFVKDDVERVELKTDHSNDFRIASPLGISQGLRLFREYFILLKDLLRQRLLSTGQSSVQEELSFYWKREKDYAKQLVELETEMEKLVSKSTQNITVLDNLTPKIDYIEETRRTEKLNVISKVKKEVVFQLEQRKRHQVKMKTIELLEQKTIEKLGRHSKESLVKETKFKLKVFTLEDSLKKLIESYDSTMTEKQSELDLQEERIRENKTTISILEIAFAETEDRYEEMRITKKLKELLRSIEMADNFKRNRAARIIQTAWRRYKIRKFRKMRRKAKLKRKPRIPGERKSRDRKTQGSEDCFSSDTSATTTRTRIGHSLCFSQIERK